VLGWLFIKYSSLVLSASPPWCLMIPEPLIPAMPLLYCNTWLQTVLYHPDDNRTLKSLDRNEIIKNSCVMAQLSLHFSADRTGLRPVLDLPT